MRIWEVFLAFLEVGAVSFGGGYGMISLIREKVVDSGWMSEENFLNLLAVSESTPGPIAVNMATFVGSERAGIYGAIAATIGVVLPAFLIILFIAALMRNLLKYSSVQAVLRGIRPCVVALILATALSLLAGTVFGLDAVGEVISFLPDWMNCLIFAILAIGMMLWKICRKKGMPPILLILLSAFLGIAVEFI